MRDQPVLRRRAAPTVSTVSRRVNLRRRITGVLQTRHTIFNSGKGACIKCCAFADYALSLRDIHSELRVSLGISCFIANSKWFTTRRGVQRNCVGISNIGDRRPKVPAHVAPLEPRWPGGRSTGRACGGRKPPEPGSPRLWGAAEEVPEAPADLGATGHAFWERLWSSCDGISPVADHEAVAEIARLMDDQEIVRCRATRTADLRELRVVIARSRALSSSLASLGFNLEPTLDSG